jgi:hypothetical protein
MGPGIEFQPNRECPDVPHAVNAGFDPIGAGHWFQNWIEDCVDDISQSLAGSSTSGMLYRLNIVHRVWRERIVGRKQFHDKTRP